MSKWIAIAVLGLVTTACGGSSGTDASTTAQAPPTSEAEPATTEAAPTTIAAATTTTTLDPAEAEWEAVDPWVTGGRAGEYRTQRFDPAFRFTILSGWWNNFAESTTRLEMTTNNNQPSPEFIVIRLGQETLEETVDWITQHPGIDSTSEDITIGGAPGIHVAATSSDFARIADAVHCVVGGECSFWIGDVNGSIVTFALLGISPQKYTELEEGAQTIIDSIVWKDLP